MIEILENAHMTGILLYLLAHNGDYVQMGDIRRKFVVSPRTRDCLDKLEAGNLIFIVQDGRYKYVSLTDNGVEIAKLLDVVDSLMRKSWLE